MNEELRIKDSIAKAIANVLEAEKIMDVTAHVQIPSDPKHGDYTSNVAMIAAKKLRKNPLEVAETLKASFSGIALPGIRQIDVVKPGFLNFWVDQEHIIASLNQSIEPVKGLAFKNIVIRGEAKRVMVEFTDPNPFKEFHIGHLYSNVVGESLSRLLEAVGNDVWRVTYQGDVGLHVAKSLWGMMEKGKALGLSSNQQIIHKMEAMSLEDRVRFMGEAYALGSTKYEESQEIKEEIHSINKMVYAKDSYIWSLYEQGRQWTLDHFESIYHRLGSDFKHNYFESVTGPAGLELVKKHLVDGVFKESDGAVIFEGEKHGLHNRVFINSLGLPTYEAKDMALPALKYKDFPYDTSIIITADEQSAYFKVVLKALSLIEPELAIKTKHIAHGVVDVKDDQGNRIKMSSRKGNVITGEWLLDEAKRRITETYSDMDSETSEKVAVAAVKYALLKSGIGKNIEFSFEESISFEGNSGPYLQYTYVRTQSILKKAEKQYTSLNPYHDDLEEEEVVLLRTLLHFPEVVEKAANELAPSHVATYLFDLAQKFNNFYQKHKIIESEQKVFRVGLTSVVGETIKKGLDILGIPVPQKM